MPICNIDIEQTNCFNENIKYIIGQLKNNLNNIDVLENKAYFAEWSLLWLDAIISLRNSGIKKDGVNNGN